MYSLMWFYTIIYSHLIASIVADIKSLNKDSHGLVELKEYQLIKSQIMHQVQETKEQETIERLSEQCTKDNIKKTDYDLD